MKDWTGTKQFILSGNNRKDNAEINDYYATEPKAVEILLENEKFNNPIWECACGEGHISKVLETHGYTVISTDLIYRGYGEKEPFDFLNETLEDFNGDIITNPPYKFAQEFVEIAIETVKEGHKVAMFLKLTFLEGKSRKKLFEKYPPKTVYVFSSRVCCGKNGVFNSKNNAVAYAWFIWIKGFKGNTVIKWVN